MSGTMSDPADIQRMVGDVVRLGTIESVDLAAATCRVEIGDIVTGDCPWFAPRAGATRIWSPPSVGEQCAFICPDGDTEAGFAILGLFSDANPAPSAEQLDLIQFEDGAIISYDAATHELVAKLPAGGKANITADGGIKITGDVEITGKVTVTEDVIAAGISLKSHKHSGVAAGAAKTGAPE